MLGSHDDALFGPAHCQKVAPFKKVDPVASQRRPDERGSFGLIARKDLALFHDCDGGSEPPERLSHLEADRSSADDDEVIGPFAQAKDRLIGERLGVSQPGNVGDKGMGSGGNDITAGANAMGPGNHLVAAREAGGLGDHANAQSLEALHAVVRRDGSDDLMDVVMDAAEVDARAFARPHAELPPAGGCMRGVGGRNQRL